MCMKSEVITNDWEEPCPGQGYEKDLSLTTEGNQLSVYQILFLYLMLLVYAGFVSLVCSDYD